MIGRADVLEMRQAIDHWKADGLDLTPILTPAKPAHAGVGVRCTTQQDHKLELALDNEIVRQAAPALERGEAVRIALPIVNTNRTVGTILSHELVKKWGEHGLPDGTVQVNFTGSAGQSFGAFLAGGVTLELEGDANDYVGKGLSGGKIIVYPPRESSFVAEDNLLIGNVVLYGATSGQAFFRGRAAERFCVRNSGAHAVVEGVGDHGCEYMTGGRVVILGSTGLNFAAGMSGGIAYVLDESGDFAERCNTEMVDLDPVETDEDIQELRQLIEAHRELTGSAVATRVLADWPGRARHVRQGDAGGLQARFDRGAATGCGARCRRARLGDPVGNPVGFKTIPRQPVPYRDPGERRADFGEVYTRPGEDHLRSQGARCMDCGVPFCQSDTGCPIDNLIPEWNDLVYQGRWRDALERLHKTNNFPEFTGRVCPAPCEGSCVLGINNPAVTIKNIENAIIDKGFEEGWVRRQSSPRNRAAGKRICHRRLRPRRPRPRPNNSTVVGHTVTVYEREDRIGGLLMYGIPNMKLDKGIVERRLDLMRQAGVEFRTGVDVGKTLTVDELQRDNDAVLLATGATVPRDLPIPGRELNGIHFAMEFLTANTRSLLDSKLADGNYISAQGKRVIVIGGGDTGTDCIGTSVRHGCDGLINLELLSEPPTDRNEDNPWPQWPLIMRTDYGHEEAATAFGQDPRQFSVMSKSFVDDGAGNVAGLKIVEVEWARRDGQWQMTELPGTERELEADLVLLAMGFLGPEHYVSDALGITYDARSNYLAEHSVYQTSVPGVFAAGDCRRGQSLVVWGMNEGRGAARAIDLHLTGQSTLPAPGWTQGD